MKACQTNLMGSYQKSDKAFFFSGMTSAGISEGEIRDKNHCSPPTQLQRACRHTHTHTAGSHQSAICTDCSRVKSLIRAHCDTRAFLLTCEDFDGNGLFLLDGLRVREAGVADVVVPGILSKDVREVKVSV